MNDGTNHPVFPNPLGTENPENTTDAIPQSLLDEKQFQNVLITRDGEPDCIPLSTNINLKCNKRMLYFPMDFGELTIDGLIDTGALSSAIPEMDLRKIRLLSPQSVIREGPPPNFQIMVANGQLETPKSTIELKFEVGDIEFHEFFIVMEHLTGPIIGLMFLQRNLDKVIKADQCAQYVDDIGIVANDVDQLMTNLRATFKCIQDAGLKLTMHKCHFGAKEIDLASNTRRQTPETERAKLSGKDQIPEVEKGFTTIFGIPKLLQKLCPKTLRTPCSILQDAQK